jgi:hypothetical protein
MSKSNSYKWHKTGKKSWVLHKKNQDNKPVCTHQKHNGFLLKLTNGLKKTMKETWTWITLATARVRILLAAFILGINRYQLSYALLEFTNNPIYVSKKNEGNRNDKNCGGKGNCKE